MSTTLHTGGVIALEQQTWVSLLGMAGFTIALAGYLHSVINGLRTEFRTEIRTAIADCRSELKDEISRTRSELKADIADVRSDIARLDGRMTTIEQRTYDLSTRLPPAPAQQP